MLHPHSAAISANVNEEKFLIEIILDFISIDRLCRFMIALNLNVVQNYAQYRLTFRINHR